MVGIHPVNGWTWSDRQKLPQRTKWYNSNLATTSTSTQCSFQRSANVPNKFAILDSCH